MSDEGRQLGDGGAARHVALDGQEFGGVFGAHLTDLTRFAMLMTGGDRGLAEDAVHDAYLAMLPKWRDGVLYDVRAYARVTITNRLIALGKRRRRFEQFVSRRNGDDRAAGSPFDRVADHEAVWEALRKLPERQRSVIVLRFFEDLSVAETAELLDISEGTVKSTTADALGRLRERFGDRLR